MTVGKKSGETELVPTLERAEVAVMLQRFGPSKRALVRTLGLGPATVDALLDPNGRVARKVLDRVRARLSEP